MKKFIFEFGGVVIFVCVVFCALIGTFHLMSRPEIRGMLIAIDCAHHDPKTGVFVQHETCNGKPLPN